MSAQRIGARIAGQVGEKAQAAAIVQKPVRGEDIVVEPCGTESHAGKMWRDLLAAYCQQILHELQSLARCRRCKPIPIELGGTEGFLRQRIGNVVAVLCIRILELGAASRANGFRHIALEIAEEWKWLRRAPLVPH